MKSIFTKTTILVGALVAATAANAAHVETGSFLNRTAHSSGQLCEQVHRDAQVRDRYERHFRMSEDELIRMFRHLHEARLEQSGSYVVYNVHDDNVIRARVFMLKKGTLVFENEEGKPILKSSCGNPMVAPTPKVVVIVPPSKPTPPIIAPPAPVIEENRVTIITPPAPEAPPVVVPSAPVTNVYRSGDVYNSAKSSLFILPILLFINNHHTTNNTTTCTKQPVPEPTSMLVMGIGAGVMAIRRRKKKSS